MITTAPRPADYESIRPSLAHLASDLQWKLFGHLWTRPLDHAFATWDLREGSAATSGEDITTVSNDMIAPDHRKNAALAAAQNCDGMGAMVEAILALAPGGQPPH